MTQAVPADITPARPGDPRNVHLGPLRLITIPFNGTTDTESGIIDKSEYSIVELNFPVLLAAGLVKIKGSMTRTLSEFQFIQDVEIEGSAGGKGTTLAAGFPYIIIVPAVVEAKAIHVSLLKL
jgi:hypothetical protein